MDGGGQTANEAFGGLDGIEGASSAKALLQAHSEPAGSHGRRMCVCRGSKEGWGESAADSDGTTSCSRCTSFCQAPVKAAAGSGSDGPISEEPRTGRNCLEHLLASPPTHLSSHPSRAAVPVSPSMASTLRPLLLRHAARPPPVRPALFSAVPRWAQSSPLAARAAAFQTSARRNILPPLPQRVQGTVNEAAQVPTSDPMHGSYHWSFERCAESNII